MNDVLLYLVNMVVTLLPPTRAFGLKRFLWQKVGAVVGDGTKINAGAKIWGGGLVIIGSDTWLGINLSIIAPVGASVTIGSSVDIGPDVMLECGTHEKGESNRRAGAPRADSIEIGSGTWVGCRATLLGGASVGAGSIVAAGALVLPGKYPDNMLLKGVPARVSPIRPQIGGKL